MRSMSVEVRFKVRQRAVESPCRCGSGGGIYILHFSLLTYVPPSLSSILSLPLKKVQLWAGLFRQTETWSLKRETMFHVTLSSKSGTNRPVIPVFRVTTRVFFNDFGVQICIFDCKFAVSTFLKNKENG